MIILERRSRAKQMTDIYFYWLILKWNSGKQKYLLNGCVTTQQQTMTNEFKNVITVVNKNRIVLH